MVEHFCVRVSELDCVLGKLAIVVNRKQACEEMVKKAGILGFKPISQYLLSISYQFGAPHI